MRERITRTAIKIKFKIRLLFQFAIDDFTSLKISLDFTKKIIKIPIIRQPDVKWYRVHRNTKIHRAKLLNIHSEQMFLLRIRNQDRR